MLDGPPMLLERIRVCKRDGTLLGRRRRRAAAGAIRAGSAGGRSSSCRRESSLAHEQRPDPQRARAPPARGGRGRRDRDARPVGVLGRPRAPRRTLLVAGRATCRSRPSCSTPPSACAAGSRSSTSSPRETGLVTSELVPALRAAAPGIVHGGLGWRRRAREASARSSPGRPRARGPVRRGVSSWFAPQPPEQVGDDQQVRDERAELQQRDAFRELPDLGDEQQRRWRSPSATRPSGAGATGRMPRRPRARRRRARRRRTRRPRWLDPFDLLQSLRNQFAFGFRPSRVRQVRDFSRPVALRAAQQHEPDRDQHDRPERALGGDPGQQAVASCRRRALGAWPDLPGLRGGRPATLPAPRRVGPLGRSALRERRRPRLALDLAARCRRMRSRGTSRRSRPAR